VKEDLRVDDGSAHEIGVVFAEDVFPCVLVDRVADVEVADERCAQETGDIGVVHAICYDSQIHIPTFTDEKRRTGAIPINFKGIYLSILRVIDDTVLCNRISDPPGKIVHVVCEVSLIPDVRHDLGSGVQVAGEHHVGRDEELIDRAIQH